jgi:hypothetical protein
MVKGKTIEATGLVPAVCHVAEEEIDWARKRRLAELSGSRVHISERTYKVIDDSIEDFQR